MIEQLASCLGPAADLRDLAARFGPFRSYVERPLQEGLGKGLTRRHDALMHFYRRRAAAGLQEKMSVIAARTNLYRGTLAEPGAAVFPGAEGLWRHPAFATAAGRLTGKPLVRPSMLYANILLPGQELAIHRDTPAFRGMDQTNTPEWLLVCMLASGLFSRWRVRIGAAVAFGSTPQAGAFLVYADGLDRPPREVPAVTDTAVMLDTDALIHGVARVGAADAPPPQAPIGSEITWHPASSRWILRHKERPIAEYGWDDVRLSFQWKGKCYADEAEEALVASGDDDLGRATAVDLLIADLRARGVLTDTLPDDTQLALAMIDAYVTFPSEH
jgi:hypothetical protein